MEQSLKSKTLREQVAPAEPDDADTGKDKLAKRGKSGVAVVRLHDRTFNKRADVWVDIALDALDEKEREKRTERVMSFSPRYFELVKKHPFLGDLLAELESLLIEVDGKVLLILSPEASDASDTKADDEGKANSGEIEETKPAEKSPSATGSVKGN